MNRFYLTLFLLLPVASFAQNQPVPLRYDYVTANLALPSLDEPGIEVEGSIAATPDIVVFGRYLDYEPNDNIDLKSLQIGVGHIWRIRQKVDFMASASYGDNDVEPQRGFGRGRDEEGLILGAHVRGWASPRIELSGAVLLDNSRSSSTDTVLELGVQYLNDARIAYGGRIRADEDDTALFIGARFYFGPSRRPIGQ